MAAPHKPAVTWCGGMGRRHPSIYAGQPRVDLVAAADAGQDCLSSFAQQTCVARTEWKCQGLFECEKPDLVSSTTWRTPTATSSSRRQSSARGILCGKEARMGRST